MGRRRRNQSEPLCYHVTHRCHGREFLLKFKKDRRNYLLRLHEMSRRYPVEVLTYMITSNHVLCGAPHRTCYAHLPIM